MENGVTKEPVSRKKVLIIGVLFCAIVLGAIVGVVIVMNKGVAEADFSKSEEAFFQFWSRSHTVPEYYEIKSLDIYYYCEDVPGALGTYYFHVIFSEYLDFEDEWYDVDEVLYGPIGKISSFYCLSWDSLAGFEEVNRKFQLAVEEGTHKSYDVSKFAEYIEKYRDKD